MRIVLDTNVVLSALLEELADVLTRPSATKRLALAGRTASEVLADDVEAVAMVEPAEVPRVVPGDADDDQVIAAAVAARADIVISGDADLLSLVSFEGIAIVTAAAAAASIDSGAQAGGGR